MTSGYSIFLFMQGAHSNTLSFRKHYSVTFHSNKPWFLGTWFFWHSSVEGYYVIKNISNRDSHLDRVLYLAGLMAISSLFGCWIYMHLFVHTSGISMFICVILLYLDIYMVVSYLTDINYLFHLGVLTWLVFLLIPPTLCLSLIFSSGVAVLVVILFGTYFPLNLLLPFMIFVLFSSRKYRQVPHQL